MTKDEALRMALEALEIGKPMFDAYWGGSQFDQAITAIKEALAQPEQEPVAWVCHGVNGEHDVDFDENEIDALLVGTMLYTTPPQRTWVELTKGEIDSWELPDKPTVAEFAWFVETKVREKNT